MIIALLGYLSLEVFVKYVFNLVTPDLFNVIPDNRTYSWTSPDFYFADNIASFSKNVDNIRLQGYCTGIDQISDTTLIGRPRNETGWSVLPIIRNYTNYYLQVAQLKLVNGKIRLNSFEYNFVYFDVDQMRVNRYSMVQNTMLFEKLDSTMVGSKVPDQLPPLPNFINNQIFLGLQSIAINNGTSVNFQTVPLVASILIK